MWGEEKTRRHLGHEVNGAARAWWAGLHWPCARHCFGVFSPHELPQALGCLFVVGECGEEVRMVRTTDLSGILGPHGRREAWSGESSSLREETREPRGQGWVRKVGRGRQSWTY